MSAPAFPLSPCAVIRVNGPDSERFLNGQLTQKVELANTREAVFSCVLNAKGGLDAICHVRALGANEYLLDAPLTLREQLLERLDRYLIADDVELHDESDQWHAHHILSSEKPAHAPAWQCTRLGSVGYDLFSRDSIDTGEFALLTEEEIESRRIEAGVPAWDHELTPGLLPPEARLEDRAISYDKGCYMGQEIISRMKRAGKTNKLLVGLKIPSGLSLPLTLIDPESEKVAGEITSISPLVSERDSGLTNALGYCRSKYLDRPSLDLSSEGRAEKRHLAAL